MERIEILDITMALVLGLATGFINTLAGSGSLIVLPFLMSVLGLPANIANGTNRVSILFAAIVGAFSLKKQTQMSLKGTGFIIFPAVIAAAGGAILATQIDKSVLSDVIAVIITIMVIPLFIRPQKWLRQERGEFNPGKRPLLIAIFIVIGFYGGFIQASNGVFILSALVLVASYTLPEANVIKNFLIAAYTIPALGIFLWKGQVNWEIGVLMAAGQGSGAWIAGRFVGKNQNASVWTHRLLIVMVALSLMQLYGVFDWIAG